MFLFFCMHETEEVENVKTCATSFIENHMLYIQFPNKHWQLMDEEISCRKQTINLINVFFLKTLKVMKLFNQRSIRNDKGEKTTEFIEQWDWVINAFKWFCSNLLSNYICVFYTDVNTNKLNRIMLKTIDSNQLLKGFNVIWVFVSIQN